MQELKFKIDASRVGPMLQRKRTAVIQTIEKTIDAIDVALVSKIVDDKLEGQVLQSHTHKLAGSVRALPVTNDGGTVTGTVEAGGGAAFYAKYHEFGGEFQTQRKPRPSLAGKARPGVGKPYTIHFPERSFMRSTLDENKDEIRAQLKGAILAAIRS